MDGSVTKVRLCLNALTNCDGYFGTFWYKSSFWVLKIVKEGNKIYLGGTKTFGDNDKIFWGTAKMFWRAANKFTWEQWGRQKLRGVVGAEAKNNQFLGMANIQT